MKYHSATDLPGVNQVFVFSSSLTGNHEVGWAKMALKYGAKHGHSIGLVGGAYAIPTKDADNKQMSPDLVKPYVDRFVKFANQYPQAQFFITPLAGISHATAAAMFKGCGENCIFPEEWRLILSRERQHI